ncbi:hypothetical protein B0H10DRAFT_2032516 [Mycena sp. CBHHK59/15]|nr:hypothetical protein B0H10DRAFT_2032516 [Mycena sp. CBHHK59/15]
MEAAYNCQNCGVVCRVDNIPTSKLRSPFSKEFLDSSRRLSPAEIGIAEEIVASGERIIADLDGAIARVRAELEQLIQQRDETDKQVVQHKYSLRPMRRLPPEIISKIFVSTLPYMDPDEPGDIPWYLSHICRYWRDVALGLPALWSDIFIMTTDKCRIEQLETQLARSANAPLKVLFWSTRSGDAHATRLLRILAVCATRWRAASLLLTPDNFVWLAGIGVVSLCSATYVSTEKCNPFEVAPELRDVTFEDLSGLPHPIVIPWEQLTRLKAVSSPQSHLEILRKTHDLEVASLELSSSSSPSNHQPIQLPRLRRVYVSFLPFLEQLMLPSLEEIYLVDVQPGPLLALISRSSAKLKTIRIIGCTPSNISLILDACPTLHTLGVQIMPRDAAKNLLSDLTVHRQGAKSVCIGPKVDSIAFGIDHGSINQGQFVKMVESRWRVPPGGLELLIVQGVTLTQETLQRLEALRTKGLEVSIVTGEKATEGLLDWRV